MDSRQSTIDHIPHIVVVGSLNMDLVVEVPTIPMPGETVLGKNFATFPGGKGANQAVAAARLGAQVSLIGRVGQDAFGDQLLASAQAAGIDVTHVGRDETAATGVAMIVVDDKGQNSIAVASGANFCLTAEQVREAWAALEDIDLLVMPLETPLVTIQTAVSLANESGATVVLNPAPAQHLAAEILQGVDVLVPNEPETAQLTGMPIDTPQESRAAAEELLALGVGNVVLTLGSRGALALSGSTGSPTHSTGSLTGLTGSPGSPTPELVEGVEGMEGVEEEPAIALVPARQVDVVDTTAAGDAFVAGLAVGLGEGKSLVEATHFANAVGALAVTKQGAQPGMPSREEVEILF